LLLVVLAACRSEPQPAAPATTDAAAKPGAAAPAAEAPAEPPPPPAGRYFPQLTAPRADTKEFQLAPFSSVEMGYVLDKDASLIYSWKSTAPISFDFHTDPTGRPEASDSFEIAETTGGQGGYVAPYAGIHGWYWENATDQKKTVTVTVTGFFSSVVRYNDDGTTTTLPVTPPKRTAPAGKP
jgi:hypothetical protein